MKGTGLGLPLCRRLAHLLGGDVQVQSELGVGSMFTATLPMHYERAGAALRRRLARLPSSRDCAPVLVVDDDVETRLIYEKYLRDSTLPAVSVAHLREAREVDAAASGRRRSCWTSCCAARTTWRWLNELKSDPATATIPVHRASRPWMTSARAWPWARTPTA